MTASGSALPGACVVEGGEFPVGRCGGCRIPTYSAPVSRAFAYASIVPVRGAVRRNGPPSMTFPLVSGSSR